MNKSKFQLCPQCGDGINPIINTCSCGYTIPKVEITQFESSTERERKMIANWKRFSTPEHFAKIMQNYNEMATLSTPQKIECLRKAVKEM